MTLGDLGAEVIKIESLEGDMSRHTGHFGHAMLRAYNRSKKSIALDLQPGAAEGLGLGPDALRARHPGLVYVSISGFPAGGPSRDRPGYETSRRRRRAA